MRSVIIAICMLVGIAAPAAAQVSIGIGLPSVSIGFNFGGYPDLVPVPGYPVYYAPQLNSNLFFYDGLYWVYANDRWYASSWYNGPWDSMGPELVPFFVLRVPVRYYREPPPYFRGWGPDASPRWGEHWGHDWEQRRSGWDRWDRGSAPAPAPLPTYQRQYSGDRYPRADQQQTLRSENYHYQPREEVTRQHFQQPAAKPAPAQRNDRPGRSAPPAADQRPAAAGRPETRSPSPSQPADTRRSQDKRSAPPQETQARGPRPQSPSSAEPQRKAAPPAAPPKETQARSPRPQPPSRAEPQRKAAPPEAAPRQSRPAVEQQQGRPVQGSPPRESQPPRSREQADKPPPAKAPARESKQEPDRKSDH